MAVHYYGENHTPSCANVCLESEATLRFYMHGVLVHTMRRTLFEQGEVWTAATVSFPSESITEVDDVTTTTRTSCF